MYKVTIITSVYKSSQHLSGFLENITQQSMFDKCELFLMNANSPDSEIEDRIISNYSSKYKNINNFSINICFSISMELSIPKFF